MLKVYCLPISLVTLLSLEQCTQFERFRLQHVQTVNKTPSYTTKLIENNDDVCSVNRNEYSLALSLPRSRQLTSLYNALLGELWPLKLVASL